MVLPSEFSWNFDEQADINAVIRDYLPGWVMDDKVSILSKTDANYSISGSCAMVGSPTYYYSHELIDSSGTTTILTTSYSSTDTDDMVISVVNDPVDWTSQKITYWIDYTNMDRYSNSNYNVYP